LWSYDHAVGPTLEVPLSIENFYEEKRILNLLKSDCCGVMD
jgi:hypothetical protein